MFLKKAPTRAIGALIAGLGGACDTGPENFTTPVALQACVDNARREVRVNMIFDVGDYPMEGPSLVVYHRRKILSKVSPDSFTTDLTTTIDLIGFPSHDSGRKQVTKKVPMKGDFVEGVEVQTRVEGKGLKVNHIEDCDS